MNWWLLSMIPISLLIVAGYVHAHRDAARIRRERTRRMLRDYYAAIGGKAPRGWR